MVILGSSLTFMVLVMNRKEQNLSRGFVTVMLMTLLIGFFLGDFNFYRSLENKNSSGGNLNDTLIFNDAIRYLGLIELPLKGRTYTWSNIQADPLLEQLDWFFTSPNWTLDYPNTEVLPMAKITSDHIPCRISVSTKIPRENIFIFENF